VGATVDVGDGDNVRPGGEGLEDVGSGGGAGGEGESILGVLEGSDGLLEVVTRSVLELRNFFEWSLSSNQGAVTDRLGLALRVYSYRPTGLPTLVWAKVVEREI
jgi:hypothetical protein